ncbi:uncharacterized protein LOC110443443 [Mizuhopecten yessoensis]|nr:uncharacterized protein LOC110443443 [Mizuhopecten yessoensis]
MSLGLKIGIVGVSVIAAIIVAIMVFKAVRLRLILHQEYQQEEQQESHHVLTSLSNSRHRLQRNSYTELADQRLAGSRENQYMNADPLERFPVEVQLAVTAAVPRGVDRQTTQAIPQDSARHTYANTQQVESPRKETATRPAPALPLGRALPESPPSYEEAIDMPIPITSSPTRCEPSPLYQNLNTTES